MRNKVIFIASIVCAVIALSAIIYLLSNKFLGPNISRQTTAGSGIGQPVPKCDIEQCPKCEPGKSIEQKNSKITGWQTYKNDRYGFEIKLPILSDHKLSINNRDYQAVESDSGEAKLIYEPENNSRNINFVYERLESEYNTQVYGYATLYIQEKTKELEEMLKKCSSDIGLMYVSGYRPAAYSGCNMGDLGEFANSQSALAINFSENDDFVIIISPELEFFEPILSTFKFSDSIASKK